MEVLEYKTLVGDGNRVLSYKSLQSEQEIYTDDKSLEKQRLFINCIRAKDYKHAGEILNDIILNDIGKNKSLQLAKCHMFGLIDSMIHAIGEIATTADLEFFGNLNPASRLLSSKTLGDLKQQVDYKGYVVTDWGDMDVVVDGADAVAAGNDVVMPGGPPVIAQVLEGLKTGRCTVAQLQRSVYRLLNYITTADVW